MRDTSHQRLHNVQKGLPSDHDKYLYHDGWLHDTNRLHMQPWVVKEMMCMFIYIIKLCMHTFSLSLLCLLIIIFLNSYTAACLRCKACVCALRMPS